MTTPLKVITITRRENQEQSWYESTPEFTEYFNRTYVETGKVLLRKVRVTPNGLVKKKIVVWQNLAEQKTYLNDPVVIAEQQRQALFAENNNLRITSKTKIVI